MWGTEVTDALRPHQHERRGHTNQWKMNLTTGSVPKTMAYFVLPYLLSYFATDSIRDGGSVHHRAVLWQ